MLERRHIPLAVFVGLYMGGAGVVAATRWNIEFLYYGIVMLVLIALVFLLDRRVRLATPLLWGLAVWGLLHMVGGTLKIPEAWADPGSSGTLYNLRVHPWAPKYDQAVHAFGFFLSSLAAWRALYVASRGVLRPTFGVLVSVACVGMGLGALNEVIEFVATRIMPETNVGGFVNTGWDLVSNLAGSVAAVILVRISWDRGWANRDLQPAGPPGSGTTPGL
ncbi:MAG: DUF2238 domain-containing protein [Phycisphaerales bacterium]